MERTINRKTYLVNNPNEFTVKYHPVYNNLSIISDLGEQERLVSLLTEVAKLYVKPTLDCHGVTHGGFIPIGVSKAYETITLPISIDGVVHKNIEHHGVNNIIYKTYTDVVYNGEGGGWQPYYGPIVITKTNVNEYTHKYRLSDTDFFVCVPDEKHTDFVSHFIGCFEGDLFTYNNMVHLTMIVKNAGDSFEQVLLNNLPYIDRWTILDTGSTDNTVSIIKKVLVGKKMGDLYQEPFINFRDSRNRCLDLAGDVCKFTLMLDDTYMIKGKFREFLTTVRGDQLSDSFSMYIQSADNEYVSNRVLKTDRKLRYMFRIHEVIQEKDNKNVCIPLKDTWIFDFRCDYMEKRTMDRKRYDLDLLFEEIRDDPNNPRHYYYVAQTYNLLDEHQLAYEYFLKRAEHPNTGFFQERLDAYFEAGRIANFKLNKPWEDCQQLYMKAWELDKTRPDGIYFIGIHYYLEGDHKRAYEYIKQAFLIGYPEQSQYSLKPTLSYHYVPKFLAELCYYFDDYTTGLTACNLFLEKKVMGEEYVEAMNGWLDIYNCLMRMPPLEKIPTVPEKPWFIFVADGGFEPWSGVDIETKGVGGSETFIIEISKYLQRSGAYNVIVFCRCEKESVYQGVRYVPLLEYFPFVRKNYVEVCMISRYSEYLPVAIKSHVEKVYLIAHDLSFTGIVIPTDPKLKQIFCLTDWHVEHFTSIFPNLKGITSAFGYGLDTQLFRYEEGLKVGYNFIYSSYPNRGLLILLHMWPRIIEKYPTASLNIYCDIDGSWANSVTKDMMDQIRDLLNKYKTYGGMNIFNHGWVDKRTLAQAWKRADVWLYPCIFKETFCLTALEAAASKTLIVTCPLAGLIHTVGDRGIMIEGKPEMFEWQDKACTRLFDVLDRKEGGKYTERNYQWVLEKTWKNQADLLLKMLGKEPTEEVDTYIEYIESTRGKNKEVLEVGGELIKGVEGRHTVLLSPEENISGVNPNKDWIIGNVMANLVKLLREKKEYDIIYTNDVSNLMLSFELLKREGMMRITGEPMSILSFLKDMREKYVLIKRTEEYVCIEKK